MRAFHNDPKIKEFYVERLRKHALEYAFVQGSGWHEGAEKGGAVGCTVHSEESEAYEREIGISRQLASLQERIFEGLPYEEAKVFPLAFLVAIPVGADLSLVLPRFMVWLLSDPEHGTMHLCPESGKQAIDTVVALYQRMIAGNAVAQSEWRAAVDDAYAVIEDDNCVCSSAINSAISAVVSASYDIAVEDYAYPEGAYEYAPYFAIDAAVNAFCHTIASDDDSAKYKCYQIMRDKVLELLGSDK